MFGTSYRDFLKYQFDLSFNRRVEPGVKHYQMPAFLKSKYGIRSPEIGICCLGWFSADCPPSGLDVPHKTHSVQCPIPPPNMHCKVHNVPHVMQNNGAILILLLK